MIINFHPKEIPSKKGVEVIADLNKADTHKVFHVTEKTAAQWQEIISSDEPLVLVSPVYWWGAGYEFDKWVQEVFAMNFAYKYGEDGMPVGLLKGRVFELHMTHGMPDAYATEMRANISARMEKGIFGFCDSKVTLHYYDMNA